jgi:hypothetical protein
METSEINMPFQSYRATTKIHLGGTHISELEVIEFDGLRLRRMDGTDLKLEYPSAFTGAINAGWVVAEGAEVTPYVPKPAGVEVRAAQATGTDRELIDMGSVNEEDSDVGKIVGSSTKVKDPAKPSRFSSPTKSSPITVGMDDRRVVKELDNSPVPVAKIASGDVEEAISGESLEDLLPDAASSGRPSKGDGEQVKFSSGSTTVGTPDEGVVVSKVGGDWDMSLHWKVRAKRAIAIYGDNLPKLNEILAIEQRGVQKEILRQLYTQE